MIQCATELVIFYVGNAHKFNFGCDSMTDHIAPPDPVRREGARETATMRVDLREGRTVDERKRQKVSKNVGWDYSAIFLEIRRSRVR